MNIFVLDYDPVRCAQAHGDKHVVKMILETAQLLSTAHYCVDAKVPEGVYKPTHVNHPCAVWCRQNVGNYFWLHELGVALCTEYTHRYGKVHKTQDVMSKLERPPRYITPSGVRTPFAQAMPEEYRRPRNAVGAYRDYYRHVKFPLLTYTNRQPPRWLTK